MSRSVLVFAAVIALWLAAGIGATVTLRMTGSVFAPNLVLVVLSALGLHLSRREGLALGFLGGFFEASLAGANMLPHLLTRTLVGVAAASFGSQSGERGAPVTAVVTAALSLGANIVFVFLTAPRSFWFFLLAGVVGALVNGLLALAISAFLARVAERRDRSGF